MSDSHFDAPLLAPASFEPSYGESPGRVLAKHREQRGWSVADVAGQLNLAPRQIAAIEEDRYAALPALAITRGFIRSYAKLLQIDAAPLLAVMAEQPESLQQSPLTRRILPPAQFSDTRLRNGGHSGWFSKSYTLLLIFIVVLAVGAIAQHFSLLPQNLESASGTFRSVISSLRAVSTPTTEPNASGMVEIKPEAVAEKPAGQPGNDATAVPAPPPPPPRQQALVTTTSANQLALTLRTDSWIEIKGAGKNTVAAKLYRAGTTEVFDISEPVQLVVGNAAGVDATLRGEPLDLRSSAKNNIARLNLK